MFNVYIRLERMPIQGKNYMKDLPLRTAVAVLLLALLGLVLFFGEWVQAIVLGIFSVIATYEMRNMFSKKGINPFVLPQALLGIAMFSVLYYLGLSYVALIAVAAFSAIVIERIFNKNRKTEDLVAAIFILVYPLALLFCFGLIGFERNDLSRLAFFCCFAGPAMADNTAYIVGSLIGKHKLCPAISPNKTIEGAVSGVIGGALGGIIAFFVQKIWGFDISIFTLIFVCFVGGLIGQFGDLLASTFKRWSGIKDYGHIFPGHGGVMDRLDSAMVAAPVVMIIFKLFIS